MNIRKVIIAHSWSDVGLNIETKEVAKKLSETIKVLYITQSRIGKDNLKVNENLTVTQWPNKRPNGIKDFLFLCKKIRVLKPDAIIVHFGATNICMLAGWLMRVRNRICWIHTLTEQFYLDTSSKREAGKAIRSRKLAYRLATHVVAINEYGKRDAVTGYKIRENKISVIYYGFLPGSLINNCSEKYKSIRFTGRLEKSKGLDILLQAFRKIEKERDDIKLEIIGNGPYKEELCDWIKKNGLEEKVLYHGFVSNFGEAVKFIAGAYCLVVPSRMDNFPAVVLEGLSTATPVIASNVGGIGEMIVNNMDGLLFEPENVDQLAELLMKLIAGRNYRNRIAANAKKSFEKKFSMENHINNVLEFLSSLK